MAGDDAAADDLVELRPAPSVLLRHRADALVEVVTAPRVGPRVDLRRGALWVRAGEDGPGVTVTHGAASVQLRAGAGVIEVNDMEALVVVASGRAAVKGVAPLPRSVLAGQAVALTLDGTFTDPDTLSPAELATDRMVVENLARDSLLSRAEGVASGGEPVATPALDLPVEHDPVPSASFEAEVAALVAEPVAPPPVTTFEAATVAPPVPPPGPGPVPVDPFAAPLPTERPATPAPWTELLATVSPAPVEPAASAAPALSPPEPSPGPSPSGADEPPAAASALESALAGVGVTDDPKAERVAVDTPVQDDQPAPTGEGDRRRTRVLVGLVILALLLLALVYLLLFG